MPSLDFKIYLNEILISNCNSFYCQQNFCSSKCRIW